jgi:hypothetical protein
MVHVLFRHGGSWSELFTSGDIVRMNLDPDDAELLHLVREADEEGFANGEEPRRRSSETARRVMQRMGYVYALGSAAHPIAGRIDAITQQLYRKEDMMGGVHMGAFMFRDVFAKVSIPISFGRVRVTPLEFIDLNPTQIDPRASSELIESERDSRIG